MMVVNAIRAHLLMFNVSAINDEGQTGVDEHETLVLKRDRSGLKITPLRGLLNVASREVTSSSASKRPLKQGLDR